MRAKRSPLEALVSEVVIKATIEHTPGLRDSIREALDKGATPSEVKRRYGARRGRTNMTALTVDWIVDEWEREKGIRKPDESIDTLR